MGAARADAGRGRLAVYAGAIDEAERRLRELQREQWGELGLALAALALAVAASQFHRAFAIPLLLGGLVVGARGIRAAWLRWDIVDRLVGDRDTYVIGEVGAYAARQATMARRHSFATAIRSTVRETAPSRVGAAAYELAALARELDDEALELEPACAVTCMRLLDELPDSWLLDAASSQETLQSCISRIRAGFSTAVTAGAPKATRRGGSRRFARAARAAG